MSSKHSWSFPLCLYPHLTFFPVLCHLRFPAFCFSSVCLCISLPFWKWKKSSAFAKINGIGRVLTYIKLCLGRRISSYLAKPFRLALSISPACLHSLRSCLSLRNSLECRKAPGHKDPSAFPVFSPFPGGDEGEGGEEQSVFAETDRSLVLLLTIE